MPGVTSLSVLFLLLALCPLDVAGLLEDMQVMFIRGDAKTFSVLDPANETATDLFTTDQNVTAMDFDPINQKVYWCNWDQQCYVQDYDGSNQAFLFDTENPVRDIQVDENSIYYLDTKSQIWVKNEGNQPILVTDVGESLTLDKPNRRVIYLDTDNYIRDSEEKIRIPMAEKVTSISWNPSDEELYFVVDSNSGPKIKAMRLNESDQRTIVDHFQNIGYISVYRDVILFTALREGENFYSLYNVSTNGTDPTPLVDDLGNPFTRFVPFQAEELHGSAATDLSSVQGCLQTNAGTSIKVTLAPGLEDFSLLVMDPPMECSRDLGQFRQDITIPESCVVDQSVHVAIQLTEIKDILGGRFFRHFLFSCSELGSDGNVMELTADSNPNKTQATASNTSYADGSFSLMVVTSANLNSDAELTSATNVIWSQDGVFLVLRHRLATGSQHRTLIPAECTINSTSHPEKKTMWLSKPDMECKQEMGLIDAWTIQSQRTAVDDVTYTQLFPFDFQVGEEVTITCNTRECPYVADAGQLQGKCLEAFEKYESCGGTFRESAPKSRREVTSLSGNGSVPQDQAASRVMSASFTLV